MAPTKVGQTYAISFVNDAFPDIKYKGLATFNGETDGFERPDGSYETWYGFNIDRFTDGHTVFFADEDILCEVNKIS